MTAAKCLSLKLFSSSDLNQIEELEQAIWPVGIRATAAQLRERISRFPEGCPIAKWDGQLVGFSTSQLVNYNGRPDQDLSKLLPAPGKEKLTHDPAGNCLHFMSGGVLPSYRRQGIWKLLIQHRLTLARLLRLEWVLVDLRMPSYSRRPAVYRTSDPVTYAALAASGTHPDPFIAYFLGLDFSYISCNRSYYKDSASGNYWVFMAKRVRTDEILK